MPNTIRSRALSVFVIGLIALMLVTHVPMAGHAAGGGSSDIRVTLLISTLGTVPSVTLQSASGLAISVQQGNGEGPQLTADPGTPVKFSLAGYALIVQETDNYNAALTAYQAAAPHGHAEILTDYLQGRPVFQVRLAGYANRAEAEAAAARLPQAGTGARHVSGPLYASAGTFATAEEAEQLSATLQQQGIRAWHVLHPDVDGFGTHSVWIGAAASEADLETAMANAVNLYPGAVLHRVDDTTPYLLKRYDDTSSSNGTVHHYVFSRNGQEVRVAGLDGAFITVKERYGRTYRGSMALTAYEGKLAVINELPLEQYLYAVVGSEMPASWPLEALKAQAVAARTFALKRGVKYEIAHISDTTYDQAYHGIGAESAAAIAAVEETRGEVLANANGLVDPYYASNHGGHSADSSEVWTGNVPHAKFVTSPDEIAGRNKLDWYRIMLADGTSGYIRSDFAVITGLKSDSDLPVVEVTGDNVNIRRAPRVDNADNPAIAQASMGDRFVMFGQDVESNAYDWIRGTYGADRLKSTINARAASAVQGDLLTLEVSERGPSGRVTKVKANGQSVNVAYPDQYRSALGGLPSTMFDIEETGRYTVLAALGSKREFPEPGGASLSVLSAAGTSSLATDEFYVMDSDGNVRAATTEPGFRFIGRGYGHGLGMSQYGAWALAEAGYDYRAILQYYYDGIHIEKE